MTAEEYFVAYLAAALPGVPVSGNVPEPTPEVFVTVERVGGGEENHIKRADIAVQSWAGTRAAAAQLNEQVKAAMAEAIDDGNISRCHLDTDYNFTDTTTRHPRYQAVFEVVHFL